MVAKERSWKLKTIKELATELGVSKTAIQKVIANLPTTKQPKKNDGKYVLTKQNIADISAKIKKKEAKENSFDENQLSQTLQKVIDNQNEQLAEKDKQISELHQLLSQQQQLNLQANQRIEQLEAPKRSFWQKLRGKDDG